MGFLDKAKSAAEQAKVAAEQAASRAREGVDDLQAKRALNNAYEEFGKVAFDLLESGAISHAGLDAAAAEIRTQKAKLEDDEPAAAGASADGDAAAAADAPLPPPE
jgi:hypothetical protein